MISALMLFVIVYPSSSARALICAIVIALSSSLVYVCVLWAGSTAPS